MPSDSAEIEIASSNLDADKDNNLRFAIAAEADGLIYVHFAKPVAWVALQRKSAVDMACSILRAADFEIRVEF